MQNYNIMADNQNAAKKIVLDVLDYIRFKIENDRLTMAEVESIARTIEGGLNLSGTIDDLSAFYGQPKNNVKTVICRKLIDKPERRVSYRFNAFNYFLWADLEHPNLVSWFHFFLAIDL